MVSLRIVLVFVDSQHNRQVFSRGGSRNDDLLGAALGNVVDRALDRLALLVDAVFLCLEQACGLHDNLHAQAAPGNCRRIRFLECLDALAVHNERLVLHFHFAVEASIVGVVLQQVCHGRQIADVVEGNNLEVSGMIVANGLEHLPADPSKTVYPNLDCHESLRFAFSASHRRPQPCANVTAARRSLNL